MAHFRDPSQVYSDDDPRQVGSLEPSPVPRYIESGDWVVPNYLGATERDIALADDQTDTDVQARDEKRQGSAAGRAFEQFTPEVNVDVPAPDLAGPAAIVGVFIVVAIGVYALASNIPGAVAGR